jgi:uncharacterized membrane-anchored protein
VIILGILAADYLIFKILQLIFKPLPSGVEVFAFWLAYVLTRPLGASVGDLLTADRYPTYAASCFSFNTTSDLVGCVDPDVYCITNCDLYPD